MAAVTMHHAALSPRNSTAVVVRCALGAVFLVAGTEKAFDLQGFTTILTWLAGWKSPGALYSLAATICAWEMTLGVFLLTGALLRQLLIATIATLLAFSIILIVTLFDASAPASCGCGRLLMVLREFADSKVAALGRNAVLAAAALWLLLFQRRQSRRESMVEASAARAANPGIMPVDDQ